MTIALNWLGLSNTMGLKPVNAVLTAYKVMAGTAYINNNSNGVVYTLPSSARLGTVFSITGKTGSWQVAQNAGQQILLGAQASTVGTVGSVSSGTANDCAQFICITSGTSTVWRIFSEIGTLSVV